MSDYCIGIVLVSKRLYWSTLLGCSEPLLEQVRGLPPHPAEAVETDQGDRAESVFLLLTPRLGQVVGLWLGSPFA